MWIQAKLCSLDVNLYLDDIARLKAGEVLRARTSGNDPYFYRVDVLCAPLEGDASLEFFYVPTFQNLEWYESRKGSIHAVKSPLTIEQIRNNGLGIIIDESALDCLVESSSKKSPSKNAFDFLGTRSDQCRALHDRLQISYRPIPGVNVSTVKNPLYDKAHEAHPRAHQAKEQFQQKR